MKIKIEKKLIAQALQDTTILTKGNISLPILANVFIESSGKGVVLKSTDLSSGITFFCEAEVIEEGEMCISGVNFSEYINTLENGEILLQSNKEELLVEQKGSRAKFGLVSSSEYPNFLPELKKNIIEVDSRELGLAIKKSVISVSIDDSRPVLTGLLFKKKKEGEMMLVGTDGYRLSISGFKYKGEWNRDVLVPAKPLNMLFKEEGMVKIGYDEKGSQIVIEGESKSILIRVIQGDYPNFVKIIPENENTIIRVAYEDLLRGVLQTAVFARQNANIVRFEVKKKLKLSTQTGYVGSGEAEIEAKITGEEVLTAFNFRYLKEFLASQKGEEIEIFMNGPLSPVKLTIDNDRDFLHIIMPVKI